MIIQQQQHKSKRGIRNDNRTTKKYWAFSTKSENRKHVANINIPAMAHKRQLAVLKNYLHNTHLSHNYNFFQSSNY